MMSEDRNRIRIVVGDRELELDGTDEFIASYESYGVVIRAWMEDQLASRELSKLGTKAFGQVTSSLVKRIDEARPGRGHESELEAAALLALIERFTYFFTSRNLGFDDADTVDTLATIVYRGFFAPVDESRVATLRLAE